MTVYTVMGSTGRIEWIAKSFTCERTAIEFLHFCNTVVRRAGSIHQLLEFSPDPTIQTESVKCNLTSRRIKYTLHVNELVTDEFMEQILQPHKPKLPFKELT